MPVLPNYKEMKTIWRVFAYLKRYPWLAAGTLGCAIAGTLMVIVFPAVTKSIVDEVVYQRHAERLMPLVLFAALAFFLQHGFNALRIILNNTFEQRVIFDLRSDLYSHIQMLPLRWFDNRATGDLMTRVLEDVNSVERVLIDGVEQGVVAALQVLIVLGVMFYVSVTLALLALAPPLPIATPGFVGDEFAAARQSFRHSSDQKLCPRERRTRAFQPGQQPAASCHARGDACLGDLPPFHVPFRLVRSRAGGSGRRPGRLERCDATGRAGRISHADRVSV